MLKKIAMFMPPLSQYGVLHYFTQRLYEAFLRQGISCRLLEAKRNDPAPFLENLLGDPPECTLSFNGLLPDDQGRFFSEMIHIPHVACLVDSPIHFLSLIRSPLSIITTVDRTSVDFFKGVGFSKVLFMPHAVEKSLAPDHEVHREFDVVMLASCIDYEGIRSSWGSKYPAPLRKAMEEAAEMSLSDPEMAYHQAFAQAFEKLINENTQIDPQTVDFIGILEEIEMFIRGKDRVELVRAIKDAKVDIFGSAESLTGWKKYLTNKRNIKIHDPIPFEQAIGTIKRSKIILNSSPWIKNGAHERIFTGLACGALVITNENPYLREQFKDGESIVFYQPNKWEKANHKVNEYLEIEERRRKVVDNGEKIVLASHTWDQRAAQLVQELPQFLSSI